MSNGWSASTLADSDEDMYIYSKDWKSAGNKRRGSEFGPEEPLYIYKAWVRH